MTICSFSKLTVLSISLLGSVFLSSCSVDEEASLTWGANRSGDRSGETKSTSKDADRNSSAEKAKIAAAKAKEETARQAAEDKAEAKADLPEPMRPVNPTIAGPCAMPWA